MSDTSLVADTNRLLQRFFEMREEEKAAAAKSKEEHDAWELERDEKFQDSLRKSLEEHGANAEGFDGTMEEWEARMKAVRQKTKETLELAKEKEQTYKQQMLEELQIQSELLRRIAEKLNA